MAGDGRGDAHSARGGHVYRASHLAPWLLMPVWTGVAARAAHDWERPPISYPATALDNAESRISERVGHLPAVLTALDVPVSSRSLVCSTTSLQQRLIGPRNPRALHFNDDIDVGYVRNGDVVEALTQRPERRGTIRGRGLSFTPQRSAGPPRARAPGDGSTRDQEGRLRHAVGAEARIRAQPRTRPAGRPPLAEHRNGDQRRRQRPARVHAHGR